jgi:serine phosphatase RsbU (regulator of sigma subunit)
MNKLFLIFIISFISWAGISQHKIDSLQKALQTSSATQEVDILLALSQEHLFENQEKAFKYGFLALQKAKTLKYRLGEAMAHNYLGDAHILRANEGDMRDAHKFYTRVLDILPNPKSRAEEIEKAKAMSGLANVYYQWGEYKQASTLNMASLEIREKYHDEFGKARCYNTSGLLYDALGDYKKAVLEYTKALNVYERLKKKREIAGILNNLAASLKLQIETEDTNNPDYSQVIDYYNRSLKISEELGDKSGISRTLNNLGTLAQSQKDFSKALVFYEKSLEVALETQEKQGMASTYNNIAKIYKERGNLEKSLELYEKALQTADEAESKFELYVTLKERASVLAELNRFSEAYSDLLASNALKKQLDEVENLRIITNLNAKYEIERYQKENQKLRYDAEIKEQEDKILWGFLLFLFAVVALSVAFLYRHNQIKEKHNLSLKKINQELQEKNTEIKRQSLELNQQKEAIERQKAEIEEKNIALKEHLAKLSEKTQTLQDSIIYAKSIQQTILPTQEQLNQVFEEIIVYYRPKLIIGGDFYWATQNEEYKMIVCGDCTGHGVPGAMMTMMATALLNEIVLAHRIWQPAQILQMMNEKIKQYKSDKYGADGMDLGIICFLNGKKELIFAGAKMPLFYLYQSELENIKPNRYAIGGIDYENKKFEQTHYTYQSGTYFYLFSDGITDQFGEETNKKFNNKRLQRLLLENGHLSLQEQKIQIGKTLTIWRGNLPQTDDMVLVGVKGV